jgi:hypothetical protein
MNQLEKPPPLGTRQAPEIPGALRPVLETALAKRPDDRFDSVAELAAAMRHAEAEAEHPKRVTKVLDSPLASRPEAPSRSKRRAGEYPRSWTLDFDPSQPPPEEDDSWSEDFEIAAPDERASPDAERSGWSEDFEPPAAPRRRAAPTELPGLLESLRSDDPRQRWQAARALGELGWDAKEVVSALTVAVQDEVQFVRSAAAVALKKIRAT